jgi:hypothetical protein
LTKEGIEGWLLPPEILYPATGGVILESPQSLFIRGAKIPSAPFKKGEPGNARMKIEPEFFDAKIDVGCH